MKINVTHEDINAGKTGDCVRCPIALAIGRLMPEAHLYLWTGWLYWADKGCPRKVELPEEARLFIRDFDASVIVNPFSFELDLDAAIDFDADE